MSDCSSLRPLRGIVPPMVTPLKDRDTLDVEGVERLVEHMIAGGACMACSSWAPAAKRPASAIGSVAN